MRRCFPLASQHNAYTLALPPQLQALHPTFNIDRLKPYHDGRMEFPARPLPNARPPPVAEADTNGDAVYEVERIVAQRKRGRAVECLVRWKGYPPEENTWESRSKLARTAADVLADFDAAQLGDAALSLAAIDDAPADSGAASNGQQRPAPKGSSAGRRSVHVVRRYEGPLCQGRGCRGACGTENNCPSGNARCHCAPAGEGANPELCEHCQDDAEIS